MPAFLKHLLPIFLLTGFCPGTSAQNQHRIDSLQALLNATAEDTSKLHLLLAIANEYKESNPDQAREFFNRQLNLARKISNIVEQGKGLNGIGGTFIQKGELDSAIIFFNKGFQLATMAHDKVLLSKCLGNLAIAYHFKGANDTAKLLILRAVNLSEEAGEKVVLSRQLNTLGSIYGALGKYDSTIFYCRRAIENGDIQSAPLAITNISYVFLQRGDFDSALVYQKKGLAIARQQKNKNSMSVCYKFVGDTYQLKGDYPSALENYFQALKLCEEADDKRFIGTILLSIGGAYYSMNDFTASEYYYGKALEKDQKIQDSTKIAADFNGLGLVKEKQGKYDQAFDYFEKAIRIEEKNGNKTSLSNYLNSAGSAYNHLGNYRRGLDVLLRALQLSQETSSKELNANNSSLIGDSYYGLGNYHQALNYQAQALPIAEGMGSLKLLKRIYDGLSKANASIGNYGEAYRNHVLLKQVTDSMFNNDNTKKITQLQMQYDFDRQQAEQKAEQDKKDALATAALKAQTIIRNISLGGLALALLAGFLLFNQYRTAKRSERLLEEKNKIIAQEKHRAEQSEQFKSRFLASMSHEIRTPMNAVMGMTNLVLNSKLDEQQAKYMNAIRKSSQNLLVIINDILDLSKIEAGKMELEKTHFRVEDVVNNIYDTLRFRAEEKSLKFTVITDPDVPEVVIGDPIRLNQVLINLAGNAIKFTSKGSINLKVEKEKWKSENGKDQDEKSSSLPRLQFSITDSGIGIPADKLEKVFEGFSQAGKDTYRKFGGTGLGLSISKQLTELQGGKITVQSEEGKGSTFTVTIPFETGNEELLERRQKTIDESIISKLKNVKLLLAEDNYFNQVVVVDTLRMKVPDMQIDIANNGSEAIEKIKTHKYDLVLMDVHMPEMNGLEAMGIIRSLPGPLNHMKVIAMTASITKEEIENCYRAGMDDYIPKPFEQNELIEKIAKLTVEQPEAPN